MSDRLRACLCTAALVLSCVPGCGTTKSNSATEQLLVSNAVDRSVAAINFRALAGQKVFLDTEYIVRNKNVIPGLPPNSQFVNPEYVISSLRQQMAAAGCLLQDKKEDADYVVEARIGTLGSDAHEVTYGIPANNLLSTAASFVPTAPPVPSMPEISIAKRNQQLAASKVGVFAYDRVSREIVWQSGISDARSTAKATWLVGAGPFQQGEIYTSTQFAGSSLALTEEEKQKVGITDYFRETHFARLRRPKEESKEGDIADGASPSGDKPAAQPSAIQQAGGESPAAKPAPAPAPTPAAK